MSVKGLPNVGLSCFMNSVLQALYYTKEFKDYILQTDIKEKESFLTYFQAIFKSLNSEPICDDDYSMFKIFKNYYDKFKEGRQNDANFFLTHLLNKLDIEIAGNYDSINQNTEVKEFHRNIIPMLFRGEQEDRIFCETCNETEERKTTQKFYSLPLTPKDGKEDFMDFLMMKFFGMSSIDGFNNCPICLKNTLIKHTIVTKWPNYLIINLCRAQVNQIGQMVKINSKILVKDHKLIVTDNSSREIIINKII